MPSIDLWMGDLKKMISFMRRNPTSTELKGASAKWRDYDQQNNDNQVSSNGPTTNDDPIPVDPGENPSDPVNCPQNVRVENFLTTTWAQETGYNGYCPGASGGPCNHAVTGCVATSIMQVMRYYSSPSAVYDNFHYGTIYWSYMPNTTSGSCSLTFGEDELSLMMASVGSRVNMNYGANASSASATSAAYALQNYFLYSSAQRYSYDPGSYQTVVTELTNHRPVILDGGTHMWETCGYYSYNSQDCTSSGLQLYMNWGWGGLNNGYYAFNNWSTTAYGQYYDFNSGKHMTIIHL